MVPCCNFIQDYYFQIFFWKLHCNWCIFLAHLWHCERTGMPELLQKFLEDISRVNPVSAAFKDGCDCCQAFDLSHTVVSHHHHHQHHHHPRCRHHHHHHVVCGLDRTMYCVRGNYEFGITRVMDSLRPYDKKLAADTWFYAKRCFLALIESIAKQLVMLADSLIHDCIRFLEDCESKSDLWRCSRPDKVAAEKSNKCTQFVDTDSSLFDINFNKPYSKLWSCYKKILVTTQITGLCIYSDNSAAILEVPDFRGFPESKQAKQASSL